MCGLQPRESMQLETKFLRLRTPVTIGSRFGDWEVTWLGGWTRGRLSFLVMAVKITRRSASARQTTISRRMRRPSRTCLKAFNAPALR
jgi:hypothetical protein